MKSETERPTLLVDLEDLENATNLIQIRRNQPRGLKPGGWGKGENPLADQAA